MQIDKCIYINIINNFCNNLYKVLQTLAKVFNFLLVSLKIKDVIYTVFVFN